MSKGKMKAAWLDTPDFEQTTNFKQFFLKDDALCNIESELAFSIFRRYTCKADCKMCYVAHEWVEDETFQNKFVPPVILPEVEKRILETFEYFDVISTIDDLFYIKNNHPHLYDFYVRNSHLMSSSSMTDMAFIQQHGLIMNELNFQMIYEISFSDRFLELRNGTMVDVVLKQLIEVHKRSPVQKIKFIICDGYGTDAEYSSAVQKLIEWAEKESVFIDIHDDITQGENNRYDLKAADHQETNHLQNADDSYIYQILTEVTYLQYTSMFLTLSQTIGENSVPFFDIMKGDTFDADTFIVKMLQSKIDTYLYYLKKIKTSCERITGNRNKYFDYFTYVAENVVINRDYNFIPRFMLKSYAQFYKMLVKNGYRDTTLGLIQPDTTKPVPIITLSGKPTLKIEHIPIVVA